MLSSGHCHPGSVSYTHLTLIGMSYSYLKNWNFIFGDWQQFLIATLTGIGYFIFYNACLCPVSYTHLLKSTYKKVWEAEPEILDATCRCKIRSATNVDVYKRQLWDGMTLRAIQK